MNNWSDEADRTILFAENGDIYLGDNNTFSEAKNILKRMGYTLAYSGRKFSRYGMRTLVGINSKNTVSIIERRKNGLINARKLHL